MSRWTMTSVTGRRRRTRRRDIFLPALGRPAFPALAPKTTGMLDIPALDEATADPTPFPLFAAWLGQAVEAQLPEPFAMTLATCTAGGLPSARVVLLRGFSEQGFEFQTNYHSRKGEEIAQNPQAALVFYWAALERQI